MSIISVGRYADISPLSQNIDTLYTGLKKGQIVVALPDEKLEIRMATIWERFRSWIRFKSHATRLENVQPLLSAFFKNNETLLTSYPGLHQRLPNQPPSLYAKLLSIYTHSVCRREETLPLFFTEKTPLHQPITIDPKDDRMITFEIDSGGDVKTLDTSEGAEGIFTKTISAPYKLFEQLRPPSSENRGIIFKLEAGGTIPFDDFSETSLKAFTKYQQEGTLEKSSSVEELIDLALLGKCLGQDDLVRKIIISLIDSLDSENYCALLSDLIELTKREEFRPYFDTPDQWVVMRLISKARLLKSFETANKPANKEFCKYIASLAENFPDDCVLQYVIAKFYEYGIGLEEDFEKAVATYKALADKKNSWGQCALGECKHYREGKTAEAFNLYNLATKQGLPMAAYHRAVCYTFGLGIQQNLKKAFEDLQKLANQGFEMGLYGLGVFHRGGHGVKQDLVRAVKHFELAGEEPRAVLELATLYEKGPVVKQDQQEAFKRFQQAALQGLRDAEYKLGRIYSGKEGFFENIQADINQAEYWFLRAKNQKHPKADEAYKQLVASRITTPFR